MSHLSVPIIVHRRTRAKEGGGEGPCAKQLAQDRPDNSPSIRPGWRIACRPMQGRSVGDFFKARIARWINGPVNPLTIVHSPSVNQRPPTRADDAHRLYGFGVRGDRKFGIRRRFPSVSLMRRSGRTQAHTANARESAVTTYRIDLSQQQQQFPLPLLGSAATSGKHSINLHFRQDL